MLGLAGPVVNVNVGASYIHACMFPLVHMNMKLSVSTQCFHSAPTHGL